MKLRNFIFLSTLLLPATSYSLEVKPLIKSGNSWDNKKIMYPKDSAEITALDLTFSKNETLPLHCHIVPEIVYVVSGELEIQKMEKLKKSLKKVM